MRNSYISLESWSIRPGPDRLARITCSRDWVIERSGVVRAKDAEDEVLDRWAEFHDRVLGFPPNW